MSEPFIAQIQMFAGNFAPRGWAFCDGQLLPIAQNTALFAVVGTTYGGDGRTTLALPDLRGRTPIHAGRGPGLTSRRVGERPGVETITLAHGQMPHHDHGLMASTAPATSRRPQDAVLASGRGVGSFASPGDTVDLASESLATVGDGQPHNNMQPYLVVSYIIALVGLFPSRS